MVCGVCTAQTPMERTPLSQIRVNASTLTSFLHSLDVEKTQFEIEEMLFDATILIANSGSTPLDANSERIKVKVTPP